MTSLSKINPETFKVYETLLDAAERKRLSGLHAHKRRCEFLTGRALIKDVLSGIIGVAPEKVQLGFSEKGAPVLKNTPSLFFSLSHSVDKVVLAVHEAPVGVDIEHVRDRPFEALTRRLFDTQAQETFSLLAPCDQSDFFFRTWTMGEAAFKVTHQTDMKESTLRKIHFLSGKIDDYYCAVAGFYPIPDISVILKQPFEEPAGTRYLDTVLVS